jgi:hypothetical protein
MPSMEAPTYYERSGEIAHSKHDPFWKHLTSNECVDTTGENEAPLGWVGLVKVDSDLIYTLAYLIDTYEAEVFPEPGWYIVREDDNGLIWGMSYGEDCVFNEERARADFAEAEATYTQWMES